MQAHVKAVAVYCEQCCRRQRVVWPRGPRSEVVTKQPTPGYCQRYKLDPISVSTSKPSGLPPVSPYA